MKVIVILADFFPDSTSTTNCFMPLVEGLIKKGNGVDIVTTNYEKKPKDFNAIEGLRIYRVNDKRVINSRYRMIKVVESKNNISRLVNKLISVVSRTFYYFSENYNKQEPRYNGWNKSLVEAKICKLHKMNNYDILVSVSYPSVTQEIAFSIKNKYPKISWSIVEYDPFSYNYHMYGKENFEDNLKKEISYFDKCDKIFLTPELIEFYKRTPLNIFNKKFYKMDFPNFKPLEYDPSVKSLIEEKESLTLFYAGALNEKIRNPKFALTLLMKLGINYKLLLIGTPKLDFISDYIYGMGDKVKIHSHQSRDVAYKTLLDSDILVSFGNSVEFQVPGKIFEYMSTGLPIIHFAKISNDPSVEYLAKYPFALVITEGEEPIEYQIELLKEFMYSAKGKRISFDELLELMPEYRSDFVVDHFVTNIISKGDYLEEK